MRTIPRFRVPFERTDSSRPAFTARIVESEFVPSFLYPHVSPESSYTLSCTPCMCMREKVPGAKFESSEVCAQPRHIRELGTRRVPFMFNLALGRAKPMKDEMNEIVSFTFTAGSVCRVNYSAATSLRYDGSVGFYLLRSRPIFSSLPWE